MCHLTNILLGKVTLSVTCEIMSMVKLITAASQFKEDELDEMPPLCRPFWATPYCGCDDRLGIDKLRVHFPYSFSQRTGIQEEYLANFLNDNVRGQTNNSERNLSDCYSAYYKSQNNWPGIKIAPSKLWGREVAVWWYSERSATGQS